MTDREFWKKLDDYIELDDGRYMIFTQAKKLQRQFGKVIVNRGNESIRDDGFGSAGPV